MNTIAVQLAAKGLKLYVSHGTLTVNNVTAEELERTIEEMVAAGPEDAISLASTVPHKLNEKHDVYLDEVLLNAEYAEKSLDTHGAWETLRALTRNPSTGSG